MEVPSPACLQLQNTPLSSDPDSYARFAEQADIHSIRPFLRILSHNCDSPDLLRPILYSLVSRTVELDSSTPGLLAKNISSFLSLISTTNGSAPLLFTLLSSLNRKKDEDARISVLQMISRSTFSCVSLFDFLKNDGSSPVVLEILSSSPDMISIFIRDSKSFICDSQSVNDSSAIKNICLVFPQLPSKFFTNYKHFEYLVESDSHLSRCCYLEILEGLVLYFKDESNIPSIHDILNILYDYLCDVNYLVRNRTLNIFANLFHKEAVLKEMRNKIISGIIGRVEDKTVIVRKKAVNILVQLLINHPFKHRKTMERNGELEVDVDADGPLKDRISADFNEFVSLMEGALSVITSMIDSSLKTDLNEIVEFIKYAFLMHLGGSRESLETFLWLVHSKAKDLVIQLFKDVIAAERDQIYVFASNRLFRKIVPKLEIDSRWILKNFIKDYWRIESLNILASLNCRISEEDAISILSCTTELLFGSQDSDELKTHSKLYDLSLQVLQRVSRRLPYNHEIFKLVTKSIVKMIFFEPEFIRRTVEFFYAASQNPEKNCGMLLRHACLGKDRLKVVEAVGWIALHQFYLLDRLEKRFASGGHARESSNQSGNQFGPGSQFGQSGARRSHQPELRDEDLDAMRKSLERASISELRGRRKSIEDSRRTFGRISIGLRMSLKLDSLDEALKTKTDEEVADFFFYLREHEMLAAPNTLLSQFVPLVLDSLNSDDDPVLVSVALRSLSRMMIASSLFFNSHFNTLISKISHPSPLVRSCVLVALHDFSVYYNSSVDPSLLFSFLNDPLLAKNALLSIFNLLNKNIIRIRGHAVDIARFCFDSELGPVVSEMACVFATNNNIMSIFLYETFLSTLPLETLAFLAGHTDASIHESLFLKCLKTAAQQQAGERPDMTERLRCIYKAFTLSEKFIQTQMFRPEMTAVLSNQ